MLVASKRFLPGLLCDHKVSTHARRVRLGHCAIVVAVRALPQTRCFSQVGRSMLGHMAPISYSRRSEVAYHPIDRRDDTSARLARALRSGYGLRTSRSAVLTGMDGRISMSISILFARGLLGEVARRGLAIDPLLEESGIAPARLRDLRERLSIAETAQLVDRTIALTSDPGIGLAAGASAPEHALQIVGHLILAQGTIREAFSTMTRYGSLLSDGATWTLIERGESAFWSCSSLLPDSDLTRFLMDFTLALTVNIGRHFLPRGEGLTEVHFRHAAPSYASAYEPIFRCPIRFGRSRNTTVFPRRLLDIKKAHADATVAQLLRKQANQLLQDRTRCQSMRAIVQVMLRNPSTLAGIELHHAASALNVSVHTLRRRLMTEGTSFSALLDEARHRFACEQLRRTDLSIQDIANLLGCANTTTFFRAFKRWTGQTPTAYRRRFWTMPSTIVAWRSN